MTPGQIEGWNLPTRPTKASDSRAKSWAGGDSVELDAIEPDQLCYLVSNAIERHMPAEEPERLKMVEESERESIMQFVEAWDGARP